MNMADVMKKQVKGGKTLAVVRTKEDKIEDAAAILRQHGANEVEIH
jgi:hypothetical protein